MKTAIIGLGSLGIHLAKRMVSSEIEVVQLITRNQDVGDRLGGELKVGFNSNLEDLEKEVELVILSVPDHAIESVAEELPFKPKALIHTSGSTSVEVLKGKAGSCGVLYPLQTFSPDVNPVWKDIPVFVEADQRFLETFLLNTARDIGQEGYSLSSENRMKIHLAAVFACNFTNHLMHIAQEIMRQMDLPASVLDPLIQETFSKARLLGAAQAQTGPAKRGDMHTIKKHLDLLSYNQNLQDIYELLSQSIRQEHKLGKD